MRDKCHKWDRHHGKKNDVQSIMQNPVGQAPGGPDIKFGSNLGQVRVQQLTHDLRILSYPLHK